jgi:hypothetical protein
MTDDLEFPWSYIYFDRPAVENGEHIMFIVDFLKTLPSAHSNKIEVFRLLPLNDECIFVLSPEAALLGANALTGLRRTGSDRPDHQTRRLMRIV